MSRNDRYRALIIDDSPEDGFAYRRALEAHPRVTFDVVQTETGSEGLACYQTEPFDCALLDLLLPDTDGIELMTQMIRSNLPRPAIIMLTGHGDETTAVEAMKKGAQDYLVKDRITSQGLQRAVLGAIERMQMLRTIEEQRRELERLATIDELTGLYNRRYFFQRFQEELDRAHRYGSQASLLLLDLDHFKKVNDNHGHRAGDAVLSGVADVIRASLRSSDLAGRYGGEELSILALGTNLQQGTAFADRLRASIEVYPFAIGGGQALNVTCSIGVAAVSANCASVEEAFLRADQALYQAKKLGRNHVCRAD